MSEPIKKKIQVRNGHKLFVKKTINLTREILQSQDTENIPKLESPKETLLKQRSQIEALDDEIIEGLSEEAVEKEIMEKCEFEAVIQDTLSLIEHRLKEAQQEARQEGMREPAQSQPQNRESQFQLTQKV